MHLGLALGGGGARGLAHVLMLEVFDELGVRPECIAGTSMGAVIGALYASGVSASDIHTNIHELAVSGRLRDALPSRNGNVHWLELIRFDWEKGGMLNVDRLMSHIARRLDARTFEELQIPLKVVAADFWRREEVVITNGDLIPAIQASMALPGVFRPVERGGRMLVDGGSVNPVPFDLIQGDCDAVIAINVVGQRRKRSGKPPNLTAAIFNTYQIMQMSIVRQKLRHHPPTIYIEPDLVDIRMLEFYKADEVFDQAQPAKAQLKSMLSALLDGAH